MSPKEIRGRLGSFFQLFFATGIAVSYWVDYGVSIGLQSTTSQWQLPIGLQIVPGAMIGLGMLSVPESARWLVKRDRVREARASLMWVRGDHTGDASRGELVDMIAGAREESRATEGWIWREFLLPTNRRRIFIAISLQICTQLTGNTSLAYFAPQIFSAIAGGSKTTSIYITGFFGVVKIVGVLLFVTVFVDRFGRKPVFIGGALAMAACMLTISIIVMKHPPSEHSTQATSTSIGSYGVAAVTLTYLEAFFFNLSWGPLAWLYIGEIFPNRIREIGVAVGAGAQWASNFAMSQATPHAISKLGWGLFLLFAAFNFVNVVYAYFVLKETSGLSLEDMERVFSWDGVAENFAAARAQALAEEANDSQEALRHAAKAVASGIVAARREAGIPPSQSRQWTEAVLGHVEVLENARGREEAELEAVNAATAAPFGEHGGGQSITTTTMDESRPSSAGAFAGSPPRTPLEQIAAVRTATTAHARPQAAYLGPTVARRTDLGNGDTRFSLGRFDCRVNSDAASTADSNVPNGGAGSNAASGQRVAQHASRPLPQMDGNFDSDDGSPPSDAGSEQGILRSEQRSSTPRT